MLPIRPLPSAARFPVVSCVTPYASARFAIPPCYGLIDESSFSIYTPYKL